MYRRLKRLLSPPFILLAACLIWFWEWLWEPLEQLMARLGRLPLLKTMEAWISAAPPYPALLCFLIPGAVLLPFKIAGLYFIAHGAPLAGFAIFLAAKIVGTALVARIFSLTRQQLLQIGWFYRLYTRTTAFRERIFTLLHQHPLYQRIHTRLRLIRHTLSTMKRGLIYQLKRRWQAIWRQQRRR